MDQIVDRLQEFAALLSYLANLLAHSIHPTAYDTISYRTQLNPIERSRLESRGRVSSTVYSPTCFWGYRKACCGTTDDFRKSVLENWSALRVELGHGSATVKASLRFYHVK